MWDTAVGQKEVFSTAVTTADHLRQRLRDYGDRFRNIVAGTVQKIAMWWQKQLIAEPMDYHGYRVIYV